MRYAFASCCVVAAVALPLATLAAEPNDAIAASFVRMLEHAPVTTVPVAPTALDDDPLYARVTAQLWAIQSTSCAFAASDPAAATLERPAGL